MSDTTTDRIRTYTVLAEHPTNGTSWDVQLIATCESAAISRTRGTMFHRDRDAAWLDGTFTIVEIAPFIPAGPNVPVV